VRRWARRVTALCHAKVRSADAAEDLAQDALLRGYRSLASLARPEKFGPWLCTIALHACQNWLHARERSTIPFSALGPGQNPEFLMNHARHPKEPGSEREEQLAQLRAAVAALPDDGNRSRAEGDKLSAGLEPRRYFPGASVDVTEGRNAPTPHDVKIAQVKTRVGQPGRLRPEMAQIYSFTRRNTPSVPANRVASWPSTYTSRFQWANGSGIGGVIWLVHEGTDIGR
jgi:hypothetical protein